MHIMHNIIRRVHIYSLLAQRAIKMLTGRSYFHKRQELGSVFVPNRLEGYYNDLTHKTSWHDATDDHGVPLNKMPNGELIYIPITVVQKGLGHWDMWLATKDNTHLEAFLGICHWLITHQDERGGWEVWNMLTDSKYTSKYTCITQGAASSALVRAYLHTNDKTFLLAAARALDIMLESIDSGGMKRIVDEGLIFEEFPSNPPNVVLNGWIFSIYGLYDYLLISENMEYRVALEATLKALVAHINMFNAGYWSYYDTFGNIASPFYHRLHIAQFQALIITFPKYSTAIEEIRYQFIIQDSSWINRIRIIMLKLIQKLKNPPQFVNR